jgi:alkanesulfonate monooxygenase SsuD/methylene tetrahydromethanopterin reductase-like flavin-dependent oxidoreductase (luciferase family)/predicted kinase
VEQPLPDPSLIILVGPSGAGKSTWAAERFRPEEIVSSDELRAVVGSGPHDLEASADAFDLLDRIVTARLGRGLLTVVDSLGLDDERRLHHRRLAAAVGLPAVTVAFDVPEAVMRARNRSRPRPVPEKVLTSQIRRFRQLLGRLEEEGPVVAAGSQRMEAAHSPAAVSSRERQLRDPVGLRFYLQISRFPATGLAGWLTEVASTAEDLGFAGVAVMDHLIQIPQVGRAFEPIPEAYTTLAYLAGRTGRLELGALVSGVTLRNPALLAKMVATLDVLSGGRAYCGLGAGWFAAEQKSYGYGAWSPGQRLAALEDALHILPLMWGPGKASYQGRMTTIEEAVCYPRPAATVPIIVGGRGPRLIDLAVRLADGINLAAADLDRLLPAVEAARARWDRDGFEVSVLDTPLIGRDRQEVAELVERHRGSRPAAAFVERHHAGEVDLHIGRYRAMAERGVGSVFLAPVGLDQPADLDRLGLLLEAFPRPENDD